MTAQGLDTDGVRRLMLEIIESAAREWKFNRRGRRRVGVRVSTDTNEAELREFFIRDMPLLIDAAGLNIDPRAIQRRLGL